MTKLIIAWFTSTKVLSAWVIMHHASWPKEDNLKNEDDLENEDDPKNESNLINKDETESKNIIQMPQIMENPCAICNYGMDLPLFLYFISFREERGVKKLQPPNGQGRGTVKTTLRCWWNNLLRSVLSIKRVAFRNICCQTPLQLENPTQLQLVGVWADFIFPRKTK